VLVLLLPPPMVPPLVPMLPPALVGPPWPSIKQSASRAPT